MPNPNDSIDPEVDPLAADTGEGNEGPGARDKVTATTRLPENPEPEHGKKGDLSDLPTPGELDPHDDDPLEGTDPTPGEQLDTGQDIGHTLPIESDGTLLEAPASAVLDPGPAPITPGSSAKAYEDRVAYENLVNAQLETWLEQNRAAILDAFLSGGTVELVTRDADGNRTNDNGVEASASPEEGIGHVPAEGVTPKK